MSREDIPITTYILPAAVDRLLLPSSGMFGLRVWDLTSYFLNADNQLQLSVTNIL